MNIIGTPQNRDFLSGHSVILQWSIPERILIFRYYIKGSFKIVIPLLVFFVSLFSLIWFFREHINAAVVFISIPIVFFVIILFFSYITALSLIFLLSVISMKEDEVYFTDKGILTLASFGAFSTFLKLLEWRNGIRGLASLFMGKPAPCFTEWQNITVVDVYDKLRMFYLNKLRGSDSSVKIFIATTETFDRALETVRYYAPHASIMKHI